MLCSYFSLQSIVINGTTLTFTSKGSLQVLENGSGTLLYNSNTDNANCASTNVWLSFPQLAF